MNFLYSIFARIANAFPAFLTSRVEPDKIQHLAGGVFFGLVGCVAALLFGGAAWWGVALATLAGIAKEVLDYVKNNQAAARGETLPHSVSIMDAVYTAAGGLFVAAIFFGFAALPTGIPFIDTSTPL